MTGRTRIFDDLSRLMTNAMGVAQGAKDEAETALKGRVDRWLADRDFVTREEFEAVRDMAIKARTENAELRAMIAAMQGTAGPADADADKPRPVSEVEAPASTNAGSADTGTQGVAEPGPVSEVEAPASTSAGMDAADRRDTDPQG